MTRLDDLRRLRAQVDYAIAEEEARRRQQAREALHAARQHDRPHGWRATHATITDLLTTHGVTAHDIKTWAVDVGLATEVKRGRVRLDLVEAYVHAHTPRETA